MWLIKEIAVMSLQSPMRLSPIAQQVDDALATIDRQVNWLHFLSPSHNDDMWNGFKQSSYSQSPQMRYPPFTNDFIKLQDALKHLPIAQVEQPLLEALFLEKQRELSLLIDLVRMRDSAGFISLSLEIFGGSEPSLLRTAKSILKTVESEPPLLEDAGCDDILAAAEHELAYYRDQNPHFKPKVHAHADLNSHLMVSYGDLNISHSLREPKARIYPLVAHEVGTHMVTYFNGCQQPIKQLSVGLAHYDSLQEGLATFAEYLTGYLPPSRLRVIAARAVACDLAVHRRSIAEIFTELKEEYRLSEHAAFDIAVRACRGGGLTKDSVYLKGLIDVLAYLANGDNLEDLFIGKFALNQHGILQELAALELVLPPALLPRYLTHGVSSKGVSTQDASSRESSRLRLEHARTLPIEQLFQRIPAP